MPFFSLFLLTASLEKFKLSIKFLSSLLINQKLPDIVGFQMALQYFLPFQQTILCSVAVIFCFPIPVEEGLIFSILMKSLIICCSYHGLAMAGLGSSPSDIRKYDFFNFFFAKYIFTPYLNEKFFAIASESFHNIKIVSFY